MTARTKPIYLYVVERSGDALTMHAVPVERESRFFYYVSQHSARLFGYHTRVVKAKAHRSMKYAWLAMRDELMGARMYHELGLFALEHLLAQLPKRIPRTTRKKAA
jgi:hypothetical protein